MFDTHTHINTNKFTETLDDVIKRAKNSGVNNIMAVGMDLETSIKAIEIANKFENVYASVGLHPGYVDNNDHFDLDHLYKDKKVVAFGEIGLDFYWTDKNKDLQLKVFEEQIIKAIKLNLPVIIHTRNSFDEAYNIVKKYEGKVTGVFHCFSSNFTDAQKAIDLGFYIGVDGPITFNSKNEDLIEIVKKIDLNKLLIETDSPYLTPVPFRGKVNEPANLKYIAKKVAEIRNITFEKVVETTTNNAKKLFKIKEW